MSDSRRLVMTRDQVEKVTGDNHQRIKEFEKLLGAISADPVEPITVAMTGNDTYTLANDRGTQTILIPEAMLVAAAGGPFTMTITTGSGDSVVVPIGAAGDTILSGDLLFDIYIDSSGDVISKSWSVSGSNANGYYDLRHDGTCEQRGSNAYAGAASGSSIVITMPRIVLDTTYWVGVQFKQSGATIGGTSTTLITAFSTTTFTIGRGNNANIDTFLNFTWNVSGAWR